MSRNINAEIIAIGTEILLGEITDTNSVFLARALRDLGINLYYMTSVGDNEDRIADAIKLALGRAQVVITCGGLGPTVDDMTRQAVAKATSRGLTFHQALLDKIAERFSGFKMQMTENNRRQAYVPDDAIIIENPVGTAPSFAVEQDDSVVISLPGVPREMKFLMNERVIPYLREKYQLGSTIIKAKVLRTAGIGESALDDAIGKDLLEASNPTIGLAAHSGQVDVRITAKADTRDQADALIATFEKPLRERIGAHVFGVDDETIEGALSKLLTSAGLHVAVCEAGVDTGIAGRLASVGTQTASAAFASVEALAADLNMDPSTSVRQIAETAAKSAADRANAAVGIAVVSRSTSDQDSADQAEVSAIAVSVDGQIRSRSYGFSGGTDFARQWGSTWALSMAWRMVKDRVNAG